jgi:hypothetical protein
MGHSTNAFRKALKIADGEEGDFIFQYGVLRFGIPVSVVQALWLNSYLTKSALFSRDFVGTLPTLGFAWILFVHLVVGVLLGKHFGRIMWSMFRGGGSPR